MTKKPPIINCHTHIFTGDHVPPWLARTFLPWPLYYLLPLSAVVAGLRWWYNYPYRIRFTPFYKKLERALYHTRMFLDRTFILSILTNLLGIFITLNVLHFCYEWLSGLLGPGKNDSLVQRAIDWLKEKGIIISITSGWVKLLFVFFLLLFFQTGRNLILFIFRQSWKIFGMLPGKQTIELLKRYVLIGRFSRYEKQGGILSKLKGQYPRDTGLVVLPMDMAFMDAGPILPVHRLQMQMRELAYLKAKNPDTFFPFVFADPRRLRKSKLYFDYTVGKDGEIILSPHCLIKRWIEHDGFSGFKIYPALGYFPFDEHLLALFKYAADKGLPIMTHCVRGPMFYRGKKKKNWDKHPVFMQSMGKEKSGNDLDDQTDDDDDDDIKLCSMLLPQRKNADFQANFTHPLNFLCLLDRSLLYTVIEKQATDPRIKEAFGFTANKPLKRGLEDLKLCLGHFGGDDEWERFLARDRDNYSSQLEKNPGRGIEFLHNHNGPNKKPRPGKPEQIWKYADWYSICCSLILQYPNVYADISFILHNHPAILPLLKKTLRNAGLRDKVLYGTDFYVVRNHKSDKEMLADMMAGLSEDEFDQIARMNPRKFLNLPEYKS